MLVTKFVDINITVRNVGYYKKKGYDVELKKKIKVKVSDLPKNSEAIVEYSCDYCGDIVKKTFGAYNNLRKDTVNKDCCRNCKHLKIEENSLVRFGNKSRRSGFDMETISQKFSQNGLILLETEYIDSTTKMKCVCPLHPNETLDLTYNDIQQGSKCKFCSWDNLSIQRNFSFEYVSSVFTHRNFTLLETEYFNCKTQMMFICNVHNHTEQQTTFDNVQQGGGCKFCRYDKMRGENNPLWKGGTSKLKYHLREKISSWKEESMKNCNYKCVITGDRFDDIHHLYSFHRILEEVFSNLDIPLHDEIGKYSDEELKIIENEFLEVHSGYPLGVCLRRDIHEEFHLIYGYTNNTPEQFEEFKNKKVHMTLV